jgi:nuclear pore complex protein Nup188
MTHLDKAKGLDISGEQAQDQPHHVAKLFMSVLNLSLSHTDGVDGVLAAITALNLPYLGGDPAVWPSLRDTASFTSRGMDKKQSGDMMATIHVVIIGSFHPRARVVLDEEQIKPFIKVVRNVHYIVLNEAHTPVQVVHGWGFCAIP